jgi:YbbR domain-containing protein
VSEATRLWGLRLLALAIAVGIWANVSLEEREATTEKLIEASVSYNRPRGFLVLDPVQSVLVRVRGSRKAIRSLNPYMVDVQVEIARTEPGTISLPLGPDNLLMPDELELVSIEPNVIQVEIDREITQRVLVEPRFSGQPAEGFERGEVEVFPNQVLVTGPESMLEKLESLRAQPIALDGKAETFEETLGIVAPNPLIQVVQPSKVTIRVPLTEVEKPPTNKSRSKKKGSR